MSKLRLQQMSGPKPIYNHVLQTTFVEDQALSLTLKLLFSIKAHQAPLHTTPRS